LVLIFNILQMGKAKTCPSGTRSLHMLLRQIVFPFCNMLRVAICKMTMFMLSHERLDPARDSTARISERLYGILGGTCYYSSGVLG